jgi:pilus assembly protein CpaC
MGHYQKQIKSWVLIIGTSLLMTANVLAGTTIRLEKDTAKALPLDGKVTEVFVSNPEIADVQSNGPDTAYVYGKKAGVTTIFLGGHKGKAEPISVIVTHSLTPLMNTFKLVYPKEQITVTSSPAGIVLSGSVTSAKTSKDAENIAKQYLTKDDKVVNNLTVSTPTQVYLKVRFAEVQRNVLNRFSPNFGVLGASGNNNITYGILTGRAPLDAAGAFARQTTGSSVPFGSYGLRFNDGTSDLQSLLDVLEQEGLGSILAEPNLVALSGETASFLAGGEFPYPVPQGNDSLSIEFKSFGIGLSFTPTVLNPNLINLRVRPEVSELDYTNAISYNVSGTVETIPSLKTRKAETSVELASGQSFAIAGLLSNSITSQIQDLPGLANIPILGSLFRSTNFQKNQTELVIIVTPYLVNPAAEKNLSLPTEGLKYGSTLDMLIMKRLNRVEGREAPNFEPPTGGTLETAAGFNVE